nr:MAG TPA: hypothetical protein [Caudoviricetes sp.]
MNSTRFTSAGAKYSHCPVSVASGTKPLTSSG